MKRPECPDGCGPLCVPILEMNRGAEQLWMNPDHRIGCPACGETWRGTDDMATQAERAESAWNRAQERRRKTADRKRKEDELRARLADALKGTTR